MIATGKLLGRTAAGSGDVEEIAVGSGLTLSGGSLRGAVAGRRPLKKGMYGGRLGKLIDNLNQTLMVGIDNKVADAHVFGKLKHI